MSRDVCFTNEKMSDKRNDNHESEVFNKSSDNNESTVCQDSDKNFESFDSTLEDEENNENQEDNTAEADKENGFQEESQQPMRRISKRSTKRILPDRLILKVTDEMREPKTLSEALSSKNKVQWIQAMKEEMESLKKNETWKLSKLPDDRTAIGCKWVYKVKGDAKGNTVRFKARLVAQGFTQKYGTDYDHVFAPVARQARFRTLLAIASKEKYIVRHLDFKI